ncbi:MAG TPA: tetratricopeptide repeat protein [Acidobacteriota bacterium]|nr:tetratricopeptide repeat protein [Acidobacteriota bacterium]
MSRTKRQWLGWVRLAPVALAAMAVWASWEGQNEVWLQVSRAKETWRQGNPGQAIDIYRSIYERYPDSRYTPEVLWELATLHYLQEGEADLAAHYFGVLGGHYPAHPLASKALYRQGEIYEKDLDDNRRAVQIWQSLLQRAGLQAEERQHVLLSLASAYYKTEHFEQARQCLEDLLSQAKGGETAQRARVLAGTIDQLLSRYQRSVDVLQEVLRYPDCPDCRLQAQLALIQSYEFLDRLPQALQVAREIPSERFPAEMKADLIARLRDKQRLDP